MNICYFGNFDPNFSRNRIYIKGLRQNGHIVNLVVSHARFPLNVISLFTAYSKIKSKTNVMIVGYGSFLLVPLAKLIAGVPVVFDALCPLIDPAIFSRSLHQKSILHLWRARFFDWLTFSLSDLVLLESKAQKNFVAKTYSISPKKLAVVYTGADDAFTQLGKHSVTLPMQVIFRGKFLPEAGVEYILQAAKILENENIRFTIIGNGFELIKIRALYNQLQLTKVTLITENMVHKELNFQLKTADIMLGQFANNDRLNRTIPHKAYESLAAGIPYITANTKGIAEILEDGVTCLMTNIADSQDIADKILQLKQNPSLSKKLASNAHKLYVQQFTPLQLGKTLISYLMSLT